MRKKNSKYRYASEVEKLRRDSQLCSSFPRKRSDMATFKVRVQHKDARRIIMEITRLCDADASLCHAGLRYFFKGTRRKKGERVSAESEVDIEVLLP